MKTFLPPLFFLTFLLGCSSGINDASKRNENWCWFVNKETGKGEWVPVKDETNLPDGDYTLFFKHGGIYKTGKIRNKKDCDTIYWYCPDGKLSFKSIRLNDSTELPFIQDGNHTVYFKNEVISGGGFFKNNQPIGNSFGNFKSGKIKMKGIIHGDSIITMYYYESGNMQDSTSFINKKEEGLSKTWFESGHIKSKLYYKNGLRDSLCSWFYDEGGLRETDFYVKGLREKRTIQYYENSHIKAECDLKNDKQTGSAIHYYEDGTIKSKVGYLEGLRNGEAWFYYPNGKLSQHALLKNDSFVTSKSYDEYGKQIGERNGKQYINYESKNKN
jgi:antitoxin component YwqK of YwqJK toxin-antitoxin module